MKKVLVNFILTIVALSQMYAQSHLIKIPQDYATIQEGVNNAVNGDTILVAPGTYYENVIIRGKSLMLTSDFLYNNDTSFIRKTIINGSKPVHPDTASCVLFIGSSFDENTQDSTSVLQGFTLTGGQGTSWTDEHYGGLYREGGGLLTALSSPVIRDNLFTKNFATNRTGINGSGGGAIRCGDGSPKILNNVIVDNIGGYGGGIALSFCCAIVRNNIISGNKSVTDYGGGGLMLINTSWGRPNVLENNTIVNNLVTSTSYGGGIYLFDTLAKVIIKNDILYGNSYPQISLNHSKNGPYVSVSYSDIEGGWHGISNIDKTPLFITDSSLFSGNIDKSPLFTDSSLFLSDTSPCVDAGDSSSTMNDPSDLTNAVFPAKGGVRNDMGAYGGPGSIIFPSFQFSGIGYYDYFSFGYGSIVGIPVKRKIPIINQSSYKLSFDSVVVMIHKNELKINYFPANEINISESDSIQVEWTPIDNKRFTDTILLYDNTANLSNPLKIPVSGYASNPNDVNGIIINKDSMYNYPNPFTQSTRIHYTVPKNTASIIVYSLTGQIIKRYDGLKGSGSVRFEGSSLPDGIYLYKLISSDGHVITNKLIIQ